MWGADVVEWIDGCLNYYCWVDSMNKWAEEWNIRWRKKMKMFTTDK